MSAERPNILLILFDSAQAGVFGAYGGPCRTPSLDRLAREGVLFQNAYTIAPTCHPARSVIETGLLPHKNGMVANRCGRGAYPFAVWDHVPGIAQALSAAGYRCGYAGQGHIDVRGFQEDRSEPTVKWKAWLAAQGHQEAPTAESRFPGGGDLPYLPEETRDGRFAHAAVQLLGEYLDSDGPWFIQFDFDGPHPPCWLPDPYASEYGPEQALLPANWTDDYSGKPLVYQQVQAAQGTGDWDEEQWRRLIAYYYGFVSMLDDMVAPLLDLLDASEQRENTLVVMSSDHAGMIGAHGLLNHGTPIMCQEVMRVPLVARWPAALAAGAECDDFVAHYDLAPSFAHTAGALLPDVHGSPWPALPRSPSEAKSSVFGQYHGDGVLFYSARSVRTALWSYVFAPLGGEELYDMGADPAELVNLASHPGSGALLREARAQLNDWMERTDDPLRFNGIWRATLKGP